MRNSVIKSAQRNRLVINYKVTWNRQGHLVRSKLRRFQTASGGLTVVTSKIPCRMNANNIISRSKPPLSCLNLWITIPNRPIILMSQTRSSRKIPLNNPGAFVCLFVQRFVLSCKSFLKLWPDHHEPYSFTRRTVNPVSTTFFLADARSEPLFLHV